MFGEDMRLLRRYCRLTQRQLGEQCGLSGSAIGMIEQGRRLPSHPSYQRLRQFFSEKGYLLGAPPHKPVLRRELLAVLLEDDVPMPESRER